MSKLFKDKKKILWILLVIVFTIPVFWKLLRPGFFPMQDDLQAFRIQQLDKCLDDFQIPCRWVPDAGYGYGYPQFNYYPPSVYYFGAILHRVGFQYIDAVKILFILGYILSAFSMFILMESFLGAWPAFVSSVLYTYVPYKAVEVYVRGAMSEFWSLTFFPLILWAIYKLIKTENLSADRQGKKYFIWFSVFLALLLTTHNLMSLIFAPIAIFWTIYWLVVNNKLKILYKLILSGLLGVGLASFFILPVIFEKKFVHIDSLLGGYFDYRAHFVSLYKLFISRQWGYGSSGFPNEKLNLSLGIVQWLAGIGAGILAIFNYKKSKMFSLTTFYILLATLASVFMIHMKSSFIWAKLPILWYMQFPWRFLAVSIFLLSILTGLMVYFSKKYKILLGSVLILLSIVLNISFFTPKDWLKITDSDKFSGISWQKQMTISIFDYLPIYAEFPPINEAPVNPEIMDGKVEVIEYKKGSNFQYGNIKVVEDATIRLPLFDFPGMQVKANDKIISHYNNDCRGEDFCYGLITFKLPKGEYKIEAKLTDTPIRKTGNYLTLISIIIVAFIIYRNEEVI